MDSCLIVIMLQMTLTAWGNTEELKDEFIMSSKYTKDGIVGKSGKEGTGIFMKNHTLASST